MLHGGTYMVNMPVLQSVNITNYGLYPGLSNGHNAIEVDLSRGITLVLGANGIGKSTFVSLLFRMLTGPFDIPGADNDSLGRANLAVRELSAKKRRHFADRVNDGAREARATITLSCGVTRFTITRRLKDMSLVSAGDEGVAKNLYASESQLQDALASAAGLGSFSDWVLLLRYVTFYQEDRRALVWDAAAQRQVLRPLFLPPSDSLSWVAQERRILQLDSERRNVSAVVYRTTTYLDVQQSKQSMLNDVTAELNEKEAALSALLEQLEDDTEEIVQLDQARKNSRLEYLLAESALEDAKRGYEHVKLAHIANALPDQSSSARYILTQMLSSGTCVACGQDAAEYAQTLEHRLQTGLCPLCGQDQHIPEQPRTSSLDERRLEEALHKLEALYAQVAANKQRADEDDRRYRESLDSSRGRRYDVRQLEARVEELNSSLPEPSEEMREAETEQKVLKRRLARLDAELLEQRTEFERFIAEMTKRILSRAAELEQAFTRYASAFLLESNTLTYAPLAERVGQMGNSVPFPHFGLTMSGNDFASPTPRSSADSVSESQREFIDLAFRMALVSVASAHSAGTLVIDSPDSSLDAVFETKAAEVLNAYVKSGKLSKLVLTSNLSSGGFIPKLVSEFRDSNPDGPGLVDMFALAAPTAAVRSLMPEYQAAKARLFEDTGFGVTPNS
ncbi:AAA family ATPase [Clavibacter sp. CFBP 8614]|uniref:AAA family ATPase n=1 Tax=unclassified Clavibacter TaxID=2626594 RepID=UPI004042CE18